MDLSASTAFSPPSPRLRHRRFLAVDWNVQINSDGHLKRPRCLWDELGGGVVASEHNVQDPLFIDDADLFDLNTILSMKNDSVPYSVKRANLRRIYDLLCQAKETSLALTYREWKSVLGMNVASEFASEQKARNAIEWHLKNLFFVYPHLHFYFAGPAEISFKSLVSQPDCLVRIDHHATKISLSTKKSKKGRQRE